LAYNAPLFHVSEVRHEATLVTLLLALVLLPVVGGLRAAFQVLVAWVLGARPIHVIIGIGPALLRRSFGAVPFELRLVPLGGHVQWGNEPYPNPPVGPWGSRLALTLAGPIATVALAASVFFVLHVSFQARTLNGRPVFTRVVDVPTGAAVSAGLRPGDVIVDVDGQSVEYFDEISQLVGRSEGRPLQVTVRRTQPASDPPRLGVTGTLEGRGVLGPEVDERWLTATLTVPPDPTADGYRLGAKPKVARLGSESWLSALGHAAIETAATLRLLFDPSPLERPVHPAPSDVVVPLLHLFATLCLVLFVFNALLPAHDLHRLVLLILEALVRRPLSPRAEIVWVRVEMLLLLVLVVVFLAWYVVRAMSPG